MKMIIYIANDEQRIIMQKWYISTCQIVSNYKNMPCIVRVFVLHAFSAAFISPSSTCIRNDTHGGWIQHIKQCVCVLYLCHVTYHCHRSRLHYMRTESIDILCMTVIVLALHVTKDMNISFYVGQSIKTYMQLIIIFCNCR